MTFRYTVINEFTSDTRTPKGREDVGVVVNHYGPSGRSDNREEGFLAKSDVTFCITQN